MAATAAAARLTEAHRLAQSRIGAQTVRDLLAVFPLLDPADLDATTVRWLRTVVPVIQLRRQSSATLAANYAATFRALELGTSKGFVPVLRDQGDHAQVVTSMTVTGPVALKRAMARGVLLGAAIETAQVTSARSGMRLAMAGGRDTLRATIDADPKAGRWRRVTSGAPCDFCSHAGPDDGFHDGCNCSIEPGY